MKNSIRKFGFAFAAAVAFTSCAKQYTCKCETNDGFVTTSEIAEGSEEKSEAACKEQEYTSTQELNGQTYTTTNECELQ